MSIIFLAADPEGLAEIYKYLGDFVALLTLLIGAALIGSTIVAGIQYTTAGADSSKVEKAKGRLASNVLVLALYLFSATILNWILPG